METTRRGFFGLMAAALAVPLVPVSAKAAPTIWKSRWWAPGRYPHPRTLQTLDGALVVKTRGRFQVGDWVKSDGAGGYECIRAIEDRPLGIVAGVNRGVVATECPICTILLRG